MDYINLSVVFSIWALGCVIISLIVFLFVEDDKNTDENITSDKQDPDSYNKNIFSKIAFGYIKSDAININNNDDNIKREHKKYLAIGVTNIFISGITLIVLSITCVVIYMQVDEMRKAYKPIQDTAVATRESFEKVQRAFINVSELKIEIIHIPRNDFEYAVTPIIKNSGNTAARKVTILLISPIAYDAVTGRLFGSADASLKWFDWRVNAPPDPLDLLEKGTPFALVFRNLSIGPGGSLSASELTVDLPKDAGPLASRNQIGRFIYGLVSYEDVFKIKHISKFCFGIADYQYDSMAGVTQRQTLCNHWNCTDDDCKDDKAQYLVDITDAIEERKRLNDMNRNSFNSRNRAPAIITPENGRSSE